MTIVHENSQFVEGIFPAKQINTYDNAFLISRIIGFVKFFLISNCKAWGYCVDYSSFFLFTKVQIMLNSLVYCSYNCY